MSQNNSSDKNNKPDFYVLLEQDTGNGKKQLTDIGVLWDGKKNYKTGIALGNRIVIQPRVAREELQLLRKERDQSCEVSTEQEINLSQ